MFGGNAMLALDWLPLCAELDARGAQRHSFLLLDYPGYGDCAGAPSPASIRASALGALAALTAQELEQTPRAGGARRVNLLGCSLGSAAALETAVALGEGEGEVGVDACVLLCPFSSILDVGRAHRVVPAFLPGSLAALLVRRATNWDNVAALRRLLSAQHPGVRSLALFHGSADEICPIWMGRALYARAKGLAEQRPPALRPAVSFTEVPGSDHNSLLETGLDAIMEELLKHPRL